MNANFDHVTDSITASQIHWQKKVLSTPITSNTTNIGDLQFSNLEIGKIYRVTILGHFSVYDSSTSLSAVHNGSVITNIYFSNSVSGGVTSGTSVIFTATATALTFDFSVSGNHAPRMGSGSVILEELPYHLETTKWN